MRLRELHEATNEFNVGDLVFHPNNKQSSLTLPDNLKKVFDGKVLDEWDGDLNLKSFNKITSLKGSPKHIKGELTLGGGIKDFSGCPLSAERIQLYGIKTSNCKGLTTQTSSISIFYSDGLVNLEGLENAGRAGYLHMAYCHGIESLEGIAKTVRSVYFEKCSKLISLKGIHKHVPMVTTFRIATVIKSHILGLLKLEHLNELEYQPGYEFPDHESNKAFQILYAHLKKKDLIACQQDLIDAGLDEYAQL